MKNIVIFTTDYVGEKLKEGNLFSGALRLENCPQDIHKIKQDSLYAIACLPPDNNKSVGERKNFIKNIVLDVLKNSLAETTGDVSVYLFAHAGDLGLNEEVVHELPIKNESFFDEMDWLSHFEGSKIKLFLTAFRHNRQVKPLRILSEPYKASITSELVEYAQSLRAEWTMELEFIAEQKKEIKIVEGSKWRFDIKYWDKTSFSENKPANLLAFFERCHLHTSSQEGKEQEPPQEKGKKDTLANHVKIRFVPYLSFAKFRNKIIYEELIKEFVVRDKETKKVISFTPTPIIFIGYFDIMGKRESEIIDLLSIAPEPCFRFLDSSIWCRYVAIEGDFDKNFQDVLQTISWAYHYNLYNTNVCREYIEFHSRLAFESRLESSIGSGHSLNVSPFTFHSEGKMLNNINKKINSLGDKTKLLKWNMLLFDDFANHCLRVGKEEPSQEKYKTKSDIVLNLIKRGTDLNSSDVYEILEEFKFVTNLSEAKKELQILTESSESKPNDASNSEAPPVKPIFDIILLDYLFSYPENQKAYYGTELLDAIEKAEQLNGLSIRQSYWIFPMTVFNEAIHSDLQERGFQSLEPHWHMIRGADPINTPLLFRSSLLDFMEEQARRILFEEKDLWKFLADSLSQKMENKEVKSKAISTYGRFIERFSADEGTPEGSAIGRTANERLNGSHGLKDLRNHIRALLFLLGYSSGFDFPIIEREFLLIEKAFKKYKAALVKEQTEDQKNVKTEAEAEKAEKVNAEAKKTEAALDNLAEIIYNISGKYF